MPKTRSNGLSAAGIKAISKPGLYGDGGGLYLKIDGQSRRWVFRGRLDKKAIARGLGSYPGVSLADARERAREYRQLVRDGIDPREEARARAKAAKDVPAVQDVAASVWELRRGEWGSRHSYEWWKSLETHAFPRIGAMPVSEVTSADILGVVEPIWNSKRETATRVKQRLEVILDYAVAARHRTDNPVLALRRALPSKRPPQEHFRALPYSELPEALAAIRKTRGRVVALAAEFLVLTAARSGEVRGMVWDEIDLNSRTWEIPAIKMKARRPHRVPLSDQAVAVLEEAGGLTGRSGLVFPSKNDSAGTMTPQAVTRVLERANIEATVHGFRSSFRDWAAECSGAPWAVCETALAHSVGNQTERSYARTDYLEQRRELMQAWADYVSPPVAALE